MAELNRLDDLLGEVMGLAMAGTSTAVSVAALIPEPAVAQTLTIMSRQSEEAVARLAAIVAERKGRKTAIRKRAREARDAAAQEATARLTDGAGGLDGLALLVMAEAGEIGRWELLRVRAERAGEGRVVSLVAHALPIQEAHLHQARQCAKFLASKEDPGAPAR